MPYPGRRAHHLRGVKRRHHSRAYERRRDKRRIRHRRHKSRVGFSVFGGLNINFIRGRRQRLRRTRVAFRGVGHVFRAAAKLAALYKLLTKKKKAAAKGSSAATKTTHLRKARATLRFNVGHGTPRPNPRFFFFPPWPPHRFPPRMRHLADRNFAVMTTNFGGNILAPVRGPAYRTGYTTGLVPRYGTGQRPRRSRYHTGHGGRPLRLRTSRIRSRGTGH